MKEFFFCQFKLPLTLVGCERRLTHTPYWVNTLDRLRLVVKRLIIFAPATFSMQRPHLRGLLPSASGSAFHFLDACFFAIVLQRGSR